MTQYGFTMPDGTRPALSEAFYGEVIDGMAAELVGHGDSVLVRTVEGGAEAELDLYRRWHEDDVVAGVVLKDLVRDDTRPAALESLGMPFVVLGDTGRPGRWPTVLVDNATAMRDCVRYLSSLGHHRVTRVAGPATLAHVAIRTEVFREETDARGMEGSVVNGDFTAASGRDLTIAEIMHHDPPTAMLFDNDLMALGGLEGARIAAADVPGDIDLLAWDDSAACQRARPPLSALSHDVRSLGGQLAKLLRMGPGDIATGASRTVAATPPVIVVRATTTGTHA